MVNQQSNGKRPQTPVATGRMALTSIVRGRIDRPHRVLLYGTEGVGKTTWAAGAPSPIFLASEDGTAQLDVARFPEPQAWQDVLEAVQVLTAEAHDYRTLIVDTLDWLEPICWDQVCRGAGVQGIEDLGYGKGYVAAVDHWRGLLARLDNLRARRGMGVVLLAHSAIRTFRNPEGEDFDRYELKLHAKTAGVLKEWCDAVLFARYETFVQRGKVPGRVKGVSTGARIVHTTREAAFDAKNRHSLPATLPLSYEAFAEALTAGQPADAEQLRQRIAGLLANAPDGITVKVRAAVARAGDDAAELARIADKLAAIVEIQNRDSGAAAEEVQS